MSTVATNPTVPTDDFEVIHAVGFAEINRHDRRDRA